MQIPEVLARKFQEVETDWLHRMKKTEERETLDIEMTLTQGWENRVSCHKVLL